MERSLKNEEYVRYILKVNNMTNVISLNTTLTPAESDTRQIMELQDTIVDDTPGPDEIFEEKYKAERLLQYIDTLSPREVKVLKSYFGFDDGYPKTLQEVGDEFGITRERIRQIIKKAITKLKAMLEKAGINSYDKF